MLDRPPVSNDYKPLVDVQLEYDDVKAEISPPVSFLDLFFWTTG